MTTKIIIAITGMFITFLPIQTINASSIYEGNHKIDLDENNKLSLMTDGKLNAEIVVPPNSSPVVSFAADELQRMLEKATDSKIPILPARTGTKPAILLGDNPLARLYVGDPAQLPRDGFMIRTVADIIIIAGRDSMHDDPEKALASGVWAQYFERGTLFGVYDFLEHFCGVRFYFPGEIGTVIPHLTQLDIPHGTIYEQPDFTVRKTSAYSGKWFKTTQNKKDLYPLRNINIYRMRSETRYQPNCHGLAREGLIERFGKTHPEYFALLKNGNHDNDRTQPGHPGHLCFTNEELADEIYKDAEAFLTGKPASYRNVIHARWNYKASWDPSGFQPGFFNIMPQDGWGHRTWCQCENCQEYYGSGRASELHWNFVTKIAKKLQENEVPGKITAMAYGAAKPVPNIDIPDNVLVQVAVRGPWLEKEPKMQKGDDKLIRSWNKKLGNQKVWLWNYINNYANAVSEGIAPLSTGYIESYFKRMGPEISGLYLQSDMPYFLFQYLNLYVFSKLAWNLDTDVGALIQDHNEKLFGPASEPMGEFFAQLETLWTKKCLGKFYEDPLGPKMSVKTEREVWEEIYTAEIIEQFNKLFDRAQELALDDNDAAKRVKFFREKFLGEIERARNAYKARNREIADLTLNARRIPADSEIVIDGKLDEALWKNADEVFLVPLKADEDPVVKTSVRIRWTPEFIYIAYDCEEPLTEAMVLPERQPDDKLIWQDASVEVFINPSNDRHTYYQILINANGVVSDTSIKTTKDNVQKGDWSWNSGIITKSSILKDRWIVEMAIPINKLPPSGIREGESWVMNFCRSRNVTGVTRQENQLQTWSPFLNKGFHSPSRFGTILFTGETEKVQNNIIKNGSFEEVKKNGNPNDWYLSREPELAKATQVDNATYRDGQRSLRIDGTSSNNSALQVTQYLPEIKPNSEYLLTFWMRLDDVTALTHRHSGAFVNINAGGNQWFPPAGARGNLPWTKRGFEFKTPAKVERAYIRLRLDNAKGNVWFDNVRIREIKTD